MTLCHPERIRELVEAAVVLGGFDADKLATEARIFRREIDPRGVGSLSQIIYMAGIDRQLNRWNSVEAVDEMVDLLIRQLGGVPFSAQRAASALAAAPQSAGVHGKVISELDRMKAWRLELAGLLALQTSGDEDSGLDLALGG